jgi:Cd2+/Zn2+-exporting ATPase/Cu+-exporting ATPase
MSLTRIELPVQGMDCAECTRHVQRALAGLPGVAQVDVFLAAEKAVVAYDTQQVDPAQMRQAVEAAGYRARDQVDEEAARVATFGKASAQRLFWMLGLVVGAVLVIVVAGEWLGLFEEITARVPFWVGLLLVVLGGYPVFRNVLAAAWRRQVTSHTLMSVGVIAALVVGEWTTAAVVVFFMRVGDAVEQLTSAQARRAVKDLAALAPKLARVVRAGNEVEVPIADVQVGEVVVVRPGEQVPVDGEVIDGNATLNQATLTGEAMPVEAGLGSQVFAATMVELGSLRVRAAAVGSATTFGHVIRLVEEAEGNRGDVQRMADRFSSYFLPVVAMIAALTLIIGRDPLATAAVLVVACSCALALATPIAMLASIGAGAKQGLLIKGGKYLELLAKADVLLIDKTGTLTLGKPQITDVALLDGLSEARVLALAAGAERYSEHPLAEAVRAASFAQGELLLEAQGFVAIPGQGVRAQVDGVAVAVGSARLLGDAPLPPEAVRLTEMGKTLLYVMADGAPVGILAATDTLRPETPAALARLQALGIEQIEVLTGDSRQSGAALAAQLGVQVRAELLPAEKLAVVRDYQAAGKIVVMVGDGVNDAPALAQADVGLAMGAGGSAIAAEAAHVVLLRQDWQLVPDLLQIARRTMRVVRSNIAYTLIYNTVGLSLAAFGILPPMGAAVAQSVPDLLILANSSRLLRQRVGDG